MANEAFTAGIEHGGLTTDYEVRILICWLLFKVGQPVTMGKLNEALQQDALVNYFELARGTGNLLRTGHIREDEHEERKEAPLILTPLGRETAETLERALPLTVREKSLAALTAVIKRERMERENAVTIEKRPDGYFMKMQISDVASDLLDMSLYVPTEEICKKMRERFLSDPAALYRVIVTHLAGEDKVL